MTANAKVMNPRNLRTYIRETRKKQCEECEDAKLRTR
jgi:hypothetical protein